MLSNLRKSGFTFGDSESNLEFKFNILNAFMLIAGVFALLFGVMSDLGINDIGSIQPKVDYFYASSSMILMLLLRRSKAYFSVIATLFLLISYTSFVSAMLFVVNDEFRLVWFYFLIYATYMLLGVAAGIGMTIASLIAIIVGASCVDLQLSDIALFTAVLGLLIASLMSVAHSVQICRYERQLEEKAQVLEKNVISLDKALIKAMEAGRAKSVFLASASHDLRQPVHALNLFIESLRKEVTTANQRTLLQYIENSVATLSSLLTALLDISKLDAGVVTPRPTYTSMVELLCNIHEEFEPQAARKGLQLRLYCREYSTVTDPVLMANVLRNLVSNALRYTETGGVLISCRQRKDKLLLQVWDTGIGIPAEDQESVFNEFHQLHNPERDRIKGLGLGLAICKHICELMDYPLTVISRPGHGSVFSVVIPLTAFDESRLSSIGEASRYEIHSLQGRSILVIDDESDVRQAMAILLERWGCRVMLADGIESTLELAARIDYRIDGIIADYRLRDNTTGIDAIHALEVASGRKIPAMLVTGDTDTQRIIEVKKSGFTVLHKPVKAAQLRISLNRLTADE